jgi:hypothetical protein
MGTAMLQLDVETYAHELTKADKAQAHRAQQEFGCASILGVVILVTMSQLLRIPSFDGLARLTIITVFISVAVIETIYFAYAYLYLPFRLAQASSVLVKQYEENLERQYEANLAYLIGHEITLGSDGEIVVADDRAELKVKNAR